jgi:hypothetical protein
MHAHVDEERATLTGRPFVFYAWISTCRATY